MTRHYASDADALQAIEIAIPRFHAAGEVEVVAEQRAALNRAIERARSGGWRDIASAPRDGTAVLVYADLNHGTHGYAIAASHGNRWVQLFTRKQLGWVPTHWRELQPPEET